MRKIARPHTNTHMHVLSNTGEKRQFIAKRMNSFSTIWYCICSTNRKTERERERGGKRTNKTSYTAKIVIISEYITLHLVDINVYNLNFTLVWELAYICGAIRLISFSVNEFVLFSFTLFINAFWCVFHVPRICFVGALVLLGRLLTLRGKIEYIHHFRCKFSIFGW